MIKIFVMDHLGIRDQIPVDHQTALEVASHLPAHIFAADLYEWQKRAKNGDYFVITSRFRLVALDLGLFSATTPGAYPSPFTQDRIYQS